MHRISQVQRPFSMNWEESLSYVMREAVQEMYADSMNRAGSESVVRFSVLACVTWMQSLEEMTGLLRNLRMQQRRLMQILQR